MRYILYISILLFVVSATQAQVRVNKPIVLTGSQDADQQVHGLPSVNSPNALLNAEVELTGMHRYAEPAMGSIWQVDLPALDQAPVAGTYVLVKAPAPTTGPLQLMINDHGPYAVNLGMDQAVQGDWIQENSVLSLVFDGSALQLINGAGHAVRPCPEGMVGVNDQYCIQAVQSSEASTFWEAIETCGAIGQRLCSWGEYYAACANAQALGITDMPNGNWEWTNNTANEDNSVRVVGVPSCYGAGTTLDPQSSPRYHRCCFSR